MSCRKMIKIQMSGWALAARRQRDYQTAVWKERIRRWKLERNRQTHTAWQLKGKHQQKQLKLEKCCGYEKVYSFSKKYCRHYGGEIHQHWHMGRSIRAISMFVQQPQHHNKMLTLCVLPNQRFDEFVSFKRYRINPLFDLLCVISCSDYMEMSWLASLRGSKIATMWWTPARAELVANKLDISDETSGWIATEISYF